MPANAGGGPNVVAASGKEYEGPVKVEESGAQSARFFEPLPILDEEEQQASSVATIFDQQEIATLLRLFGVVTEYVCFYKAEEYLDHFAACALEATGTELWPHRMLIST